MNYSLPFLAIGVLPGVAHRLVLVQAVAVGVVIVAVLDVPTTIDHFEDGAKIVRQVVGATRCPFVHKLSYTGTSIVCGRRVIGRFPISNSYLSSALESMTRMYLKGQAHCKVLGLIPVLRV